MIKRMVVLGDSVPWGQGLLEEHKFHTLVQNALTGSVMKDVIAHSGATIGIRTARTGKADSEVPISYPTILEQAEGYMNSPEQVDLVIVNGGINDIDIRTILNPFTDPDDLSDDIEKYCYDDMKILLARVADIFPHAKILVIGYYPIISKQSQPLRLLPFLDILGIGFPSHFYADPVFEKIAILSLQFWKESDRQFARTVGDLNAAAGGEARIVFVPSQFTEANAVFTDVPLLFALNSDLSAQDEVVDPRMHSCDIYYDDPIELVSREQCYRASAGHPNVAGAKQIANSIITSLQLP